MHKHTIDWYVQLNLTPDAALAKKRWDTAETVAKSLSRIRVIQLLRLFLFAPSGADFTEQFTDELIELDSEFPVSKNIQELRMMAGLVMMTSFAKPSDIANAFALGLRAANFPEGRVTPIQPAIVTEAEFYLRNEAGRVRPDHFAMAATTDMQNKLSAQARALVEAGDDASKKNAALASYCDAIASVVGASQGALSRRIEQLAEESGLLWWVMGEYSDTLQRPITELPLESYALAAAAEAAQRTIQTSPPPNITPLLARALKPCKVGEKKLTLVDYIKATDPIWRTAQIKLVTVTDCRDLSPLYTMLEKTEELGDAVAAMKAISKLCPGVPPKLQLAPALAAQQFYNEILFQRVLATLKN